MQRWLPLTLLAGLLPLACGSDAHSSVVVPRYNGEPNGDDAALIGTIVIEDPCFFVEVANGERLLIAFPADFVEWDDDSRTLELSGEKFRQGDLVMFGGSAISDPGLPRQWATEPASECDAEMIWISQATARLASEVP